MNVETRAQTPSNSRKTRTEMIVAEYDRLRALAAVRMRNERECHTLTGTALANEIAAKMLDNEAVPSDDRGRFLAFADVAMRHYLIDYARTRGRRKRGGGRHKHGLSLAQPDTQNGDGEAEIVAELLSMLERHDPRQADVVRMRFLEERPLEEVAARLGISVATVKRDSVLAKAWLARAVKAM